MTAGAVLEQVRTGKIKGGRATPAQGTGASTPQGGATPTPRLLGPIGTMVLGSPPAMTMAGIKAEFKAQAVKAPIELWLTNQLIASRGEVVNTQQALTTANNHIVGLLEECAYYRGKAGIPMTFPPSGSGGGDAPPGTGKNNSRNNAKNAH